MSLKHFILATAGHVDHGKSALVKALTGTDPDRLPEEKARGITIDLGFAHLEVPGPEPGAAYSLGIIDVPGHEDFVKNMVAGVGSVDLALFVVAADDGWMPQTEEHLQILSYLGVQRAVVALTKSDLIQGAGSDIEERLRARLADTPFASAPIVRTSVVTGSGLDELRGALGRVLAETPPPRDAGKPRLPVDRVFVLHGIGTVVTGTLSGGRLQRGQSAVVQPGGHPTRIRSLQTHHTEAAECGPGMRTALNLADVEAGGEGAGAGAGGIRQGQVVTLAGLGEGSDTLDIVFERSARLTGGKTPASRVLSEGARVRLHHGSGCAAGRVYLLGCREIGPGQTALAEVRLEEPLCVFAGDRFIVRDWSEQCTLGGGVVLEAAADRRRFRRPEQRHYLSQLARAAQEVSIHVTALLERDLAVRRAGLLGSSVFSEAEVEAALARLQQEGKAALAGEWVVHSARWQTLLRSAAELVASHHRAQLQLPGIPLTELRAGLEGKLPNPEVFDGLLGELCRNGHARQGAHLRSQTHRPVLPPPLREAGDRIRSALAAKPFEPPSRKELAPDAPGQQALRFLRDTGETVEVGEELVLLADSFERMKNGIVGFIRDRGPATVSDLRQHLGTTRRIMMPLLERLDREGVTVRQGDNRALGRNAGAG